LLTFVGVFVSLWEDFGVAEWAFLFILLQCRCQPFHQAFFMENVPASRYFSNLRTRLKFVHTNDAVCLAKLVHCLVKRIPGYVLGIAFAVQGPPWNLHNRLHRVIGVLGLVVGGV